MDNLAIDLLDKLLSAKDDEARWLIVNQEIQKLGGTAVNFAMVNLETHSPIWLKSSMSDE